MAAAMDPQFGGLLSIWLESARSQGLLVKGNPSRELANLPTHQVGVSLAYLRRLVESLDSSLVSTTSVVGKIISPATAKPPWNKKGRFFDMIPVEHTGSPRYYIIYAWSTPIHYVVDQAEKAVRKGALVILDNKLTPLTRSWCLFEMWSFLHHGNMRKLRLCLPENVDAALLLKLDDMLDQLSLSRASALRHSDASRIQTQVKSMVGLKSFNKLVSTAVNCIMRCELKWSHEIKHVGLYCVFLLQMQEFGHLQQVLSCMPGMSEEDKLLDDITDTFNMSDTEGTGSLYEEQFIQTLLVSGFQEEEARNIFQEAARERPDRICLDEFDTYWHQRQAAKDEGSVRPPVIIFKAEPLIQNLVKLATVLRRKCLEKEAEVVRNYVVAMKTGKFFEKWSSSLPFSPLHGDWEGMCLECAFTLHKGNLKAAASLLYDMLMGNGYQLSINPSTLKDPSYKQDPFDLRQELKMQLGLWCNLLKTDPSKRAHADLFTGFMEELDGREVHVKGYQPGAEQGFSHLAIVRGMIAMKYGEDMAMTPPLIQEAEKSLQQWMSPTKDMSLHNLLASYLESQSTLAAGAGEVRLAREGPRIGTFSKRVIHDIPAEGEGPFVSLLHTLGPEARAYLLEMESKGDSKQSGSLMPDPQDTAKGQEEPGLGLAKLAATRKKSKLTGLELAPPSFNKEGAVFSQVQGRLRRLASAATLNLKAVHWDGKVASPRLMATDTGPGEGRRSDADNGEGRCSDLEAAAAAAVAAADAEDAVIGPRPPASLPVSIKHNRASLRVRTCDSPDLPDLDTSRPSSPNLTSCCSLPNIHLTSPRDRMRQDLLAGEVTSPRSGSLSGPISPHPPALPSPMAHSLSSPEPLSPGSRSAARFRHLVDSDPASSTGRGVGFSPLRKLRSSKDPARLSVEISSPQPIEAGKDTEPISPNFYPRSLPMRQHSMLAVPGPLRESRSCNFTADTASGGDPATSQAPRAALVAQRSETEVEEERMSPADWGAKQSLKVPSALPSEASRVDKKPVDVSDSEPASPAIGRGPPMRQRSAKWLPAVQSDADVQREAAGPEGKREVEEPMSPLEDEALLWERWNRNRPGPSREPSQGSLALPKGDALMSERSYRSIPKLMAAMEGKAVINGVPVMPPPGASPSAKIAQLIKSHSSFSSSVYDDFKAAVPLRLPKVPTVK